MVQHGSLALVANTPQALSGAETDHQRGQSILFRTPAAPAVYIGGQGVTVAAGFPLDPSTEYAFELTGGEALYIVAGGAAAVPYLRTGV